MGSEDQQENQENTASTGSDSPTPAFSGESRRRFTKAGLAVSGVLMTIAARSALGEGIAESPSAFASPGLSRHGPPPAGAGLSPGYWKNAAPAGNHKNPVPPWPFSPDTPFVNVFPGAAAYPGADFGNPGATFIGLLDTPNPYDINQLGRDFVTAYLNAISGLSPFLAPNPSDAAAKIVNMFEELLTQGYFVPSAGIKWYAAQVQTYLEALWG